MNDRNVASGICQAGWAAFALTIVACVAIMIAEAWLRAGWLDEYWTVWHSDPAISLSTAYQTRWVRDTQHPPTFYAINWALAQMVGPVLAWRRLAINGLALLIALPTYLACRRDRTAPQQPILYALLIVSGPFFVTYFAEYRSYFLAMMCSACLVAVTRRLHLDSSAGVPLSRWRLALFCGLTLLTTNLHYMISVSVLAYLGCETFWQWFRGSRSIAWLIAATATVSILPLAISLLAALAVAAPTPVIRLSVVRGWGIIGAVLAAGLLTNLPAAARAIQVTRNWRATQQDRQGYLIVLTASLILLSIAFLGFHLATRNMFPRLVLGLLPIATALVCELACWRPLHRTLTLLICANALAVTLAVASVQLRKARWEYYIPEIKTAIARCSLTKVVAVSPLLFAYDPKTMTGQQDAMASAYHMIAAKHGFAVHVLPNDGPLTHPSGPCPTLLWMEHNFFRAELTAAEFGSVIGGDRTDLADRSRFEHHNEHYLMTIASSKPR